MKIHFIGIGGIGISGLANVYHLKGNAVQGSDSEGSEITEILQQKGVEVFVGHKSENISDDIDLVIYSEAVPEDNVELKKARELGIRCLAGAEALGELSKEYFTIAVSGMHGKTTTACMIAHILKQAGLEPTYIIGTKDGSQLGKGKYLVIEADDYKAKLLNYAPEIAVLTNIEEEHMDYFKDLNHILDVFKKYVAQVKKVVVANKDDENIKKVVEKVDCEVKYFQLIDIKLQIPGKHNQYNAGAAIMAAEAVGVERKVAIKALESFKGAWRRFEEKGVRIGERSFQIISDYAHHPTEISATLKAVKEKYPEKEVWCVFQPHQYQRTFYLFDDFVKVFQDNPINNLSIIEVYDVKGRENKKLKEQVNSEKLVQAIGQDWAQYLPKQEVLNYLKENLKGNEIIVFMGAGNDVYDLCNEFIHS
ncbi:MAG: UDP-N-acetylmuramate--L-alanine ligase [Parcubacteria group bacterium]|nr:UDP-N-acetylmuramate--L-alanine ligase [Parcubacteria group bacterium]